MTPDPASPDAPIPPARSHEQIATDLRWWADMMGDATGWRKGTQRLLREAANAMTPDPVPVPAHQASPIQQETTMALDPADLHIYHKLYEAIHADFTSPLFRVVKYATRVADAYAVLERRHKLHMELAQLKVLDAALAELVEAVKELGTSQP